MHSVTPNRRVCVCVHASIQNLPGDELCSVFNTFTHTLADFLLLVLIVKQLRVHYAPCLLLHRLEG